MTVLSVLRSFVLFQALEIYTVAGVFLMLFLGILVGVVILVLEHLVFKYYLPKLRSKPNTSMWKNRNLMFLSQVCHVP
jgi:ionotropic glutamate receptor NMDA 3A